MVDLINSDASGLEYTSTLDLFQGFKILVYLQVIKIQSTAIIGQYLGLDISAPINWVTIDLLFSSKSLASDPTLLVFPFDVLRIFFQFISLKDFRGLYLVCWTLHELVGPRICFQCKCAWGLGWFFFFRKN